VGYQITVELVSVCDVGVHRLQASGMTLEVFANAYDLLITATILYLKTVKNDVYIPLFKFSQVITPHIPLG
jgi:hypothetical protein